MKPCLLLSVFSLLTVSSLWGDNLDERLYEKIHDGWQSSWMDVVMPGLSKVGERQTCLGVYLGLSAFGDEKGREAGKLSAVSYLGGQAVCSILKLAVNRERPEGASDRFDSSFPSGHAAGVFSLAYVLGQEYPGIKVPSYVLAGLVSISRVYLGRHYPSDVLAGALIGCCASYLVMRNKGAVLNFYL